MKTITIYTTTFCIWCWRAKFLLRSRGLDYREVDASDDATRKMLLERTGQRTVPQIFFGDESIGGFVDLRALDVSGQLTARLQQA
jgi:glutaredoxin 3